MLMPLKNWLMIGAVVVVFFTADHFIHKAYDYGVADQIALQKQANQDAADRNAAEKERIETDAQKQVATANAAADRAIANANGLRGQLNEIGRIAGNASGTFATGATARDAVVLLADLLRQCSERYTTMAKFADAAHAAGQTCERSYDSLRKSPH